MELARQTIMIRGVHRLSNEKSVTEADLKARYDKFGQRRQNSRPTILVEKKRRPWPSLPT
jgi:hypothetical protein